MPKWKSKPRGAGPTAGTHASVSFEITCACGRIYEGARTGADQVLECNLCGQRLFVLPQSPYPDVPPIEEGESGKPDAPHRRKQTSDDAPAATAGEKPPPREAVPAEPDKILNPLAQQRWRLVTPRRLIFVAMAAIVSLLSATGYWQYQRSARNRAEREFRDHADNGYAALKSSDYVKAYDEFRLAVAALERLGRNDGKTRHVRQMFREMKAASDLISQTLPEILEEAHQLRQDDASEWRRKLQQSYTGHWVVLDTLVRRNDSNGGTSIEFDYPLIVEDRVVLFTGRPVVFERLTVPKTPRRVILAVEIDRIDVSDNSRNWIVHINRDSAFLWCDFTNFRALGFDVAPEIDENVDGEINTERELRALLIAQSKTMGVTR